MTIPKAVLQLIFEFCRTSRVVAAKSNVHMQLALQ
jgi:hypothetical protein